MFHCVLYSGASPIARYSLSGGGGFALQQGSVNMYICTVHCIQTNTFIPLSCRPNHNNFSWEIWALQELYRLYPKSYNIISNLIPGYKGRGVPWLIIIFIWSRDGSVGIAMGYRLDSRGSSPQSPDRLCCPPIFLSNGYRELFPLR
jgi:hypothetical protein